MTTTYTWNITKLECSDADNDGHCDIIISADWMISGNNGNNISTVTGRTPLNIVISAGEGLTEDEVFANVTESEVINSIQTVLGTQTISQYQTNINNELDRLDLPAPVIPPLPWVV